MGYKVSIYSGEIPSTVFIERLIKTLSSAGVTIYLFGRRSKKFKYSSDIKIVSFRDNKISKGIHFLKYSILLFVFKPKAKARLDALIKKESKHSLLSKTKYYPVLWCHPNIFHLQWAKDIKDWMWVQEFGIKLILSLRGAHINYSPIADKQLATLYRKNFPLIDGFHAVSRAIAYEAQNYGASKEKIKLVYSGLDLVQLPYVQKTHLNKPLNIISIGRSHWKKGYHYALDALKDLNLKKIDFKYTIIGIEQNEELLFQRSSLDLDEHVSFHRPMEFSSVLDEIKSADVLLLSSVEEGIANVVLEAMALGTLVITTDCGGMSEVITNRINGFLVPVRDYKSLSIVLELVSHISVNDYVSMTKAARQTIEEQFEIHHMQRQMLALYDEVIDINY